MTYNYNHITLVGTLTEAPDLKAINGVLTTRIILKIDRNNDSEPTETDFIPCVFQNELAKSVHKLFKKDSPILVEGRLLQVSTTSKKVTTYGLQVSGENFQALEPNK